ncbi:hypothetical protein CCH79_00020347, partial [Gambusia affinis]
MDNGHHHNHFSTSDRKVRKVERLVHLETLQRIIFLLDLLTHVWQLEIQLASPAVRCWAWQAVLMFLKLQRCFRQTDMMSAVVDDCSSSGSFEFIFPYKNLAALMKMINKKSMDLSQSTLQVSQPSANSGGMISSAAASGSPTPVLKGYRPATFVPKCSKMSEFPHLHPISSAIGWSVSSSVTDSSPLSSVNPDASGSTNSMDSSRMDSISHDALHKFKKNGRLDEELKWLSIQSLPSHHIKLPGARLEEPQHVLPVAEPLGQVDIQDVGQNGDQLGGVAQCSTD